VRPSIVDKALKAEEVIHEGLRARSEDFDFENGDLFSVKHAMLFAVIENDERVTLTLACEGADVYDLLDSDDTRQVAKVSDYVALLTCGWAAPVDHDDPTAFDGPPSEHPDKRRVRLVVLACAEGVASVMRFADTPDEVISDNDQARGSLADAVKQLFITA